MKRKISLLLVCMILAISLCACGNKDDVKDAIRGKWSYSVSSINGTCYQNFDFDKDGTVEVSWINSGDSSKNSYHDGKYSIKKDTVVIKYDDGTNDDVLDYTYKNDTLTLFDTGSDGSLNNELKKQ